MSSIVLPQIAKPSYASGFATGRSLARARYPQLWRNCVFAASPSLGPQGYTLQDQSGNANHGTLTNYTVSPDYSDGLLFDGTDDYVEMTKSPIASGTTRWTMSAWVYRVGAGTSGWGNGIIFESTGGGAGWSRNVFRLDYSNNKITFGYRDAPTGDFDGWHQGNSAVGSNAWHHVAVAVDTVANTAAFYLDGASDGTPSTEGKGAITTAGSIRPIGAGQRTNGNAIYHGWFDGLIDDVRIYSRALSPQEVAILALRRNISYELAPRYYALPGEAAATETRQSLTLLGVG